MKLLANFLSKNSILHQGASSGGKGREAEVKPQESQKLGQRSQTKATISLFPLALLI